MGNHQAGHAMGLMAQMLYERRRPGESALQLLDVICEPYRGCDAEFESTNPQNPSQVGDPADYRYPPWGLGQLMIEAFAPNGAADVERYRGLDLEDDVYDTFYEQVIRPFAERYEFC